MESGYDAHVCLFPIVRMTCLARSPTSLFRRDNCIGRNNNDYEILWQRKRISIPHGSNDPSNSILGSFAEFIIFTEAPSQGDGIMIMQSCYDAHDIYSKGDNDMLLSNRASFANLKFFTGGRCLGHPNNAYGI